MPVETRSYGPHHFARVENMDDICELLLLELRKQNGPKTTGGLITYKAEAGDVWLKLNIEIIDSSKVIEVPPEEPSPSAHIS